MRPDGSQQITGPTVVQEEDPLTQSPQRRGAELIAAGIALRDVVSQTCTHVVNLEVGKRTHRRSAQGASDVGGLSGTDRRRMTDRATDRREQRGTVRYRSCTTRSGR